MSSTSSSSTSVSQVPYNKTSSITTTASSISSPKCKQCGAWGLQVVQLNGYCSHCNRLQSSTTVGGSIKRPRDDNDNEKKHSNTTIKDNNNNNNNNNNVPSVSITDGNISSSSSSSNEEITRLLQQADTSDIPTLDASGVKRMFLKVEKAINKNQLQRSKYTDQPMQYLDSEIELDNQLKLLRTLAAVPEYYSLIIQSNTLPSLLNLFLHENTLIAMDIVNFFTEIWSEDIVGTSNDDDDDDDNDDTKRTITPYAAGKQLLIAVVEQNGLEYLMDIMERLLETCDDDIDDTENLLQIVTLIIRMMEYQPSIVIPQFLQLTKKVTIATSLLSTSATGTVLPSSSATTNLVIPRFFDNLLRYIYTHRLSTTMTNKTNVSSFSSSNISLTSNLHQNDLLFACAECLAIALSLHMEGNSTTVFGTSFYKFQSSSSSSSKSSASSGNSSSNNGNPAYYINGIEYLLEIINRYKKYTSSNHSQKDEEEFINNLYDCLITSLLLYDNQEKFRTAEGFELMLRIIHENTYTRYNAFRILSYAITNNVENCTYLIRQNGLKIIFPVFMGYTYHTTKKDHGNEAAKQEEELTLTILATCLLLLPHGNILNNGTLPVSQSMTTGLSSSTSSTSSSEGIEWLRTIGKFIEITKDSSTTTNNVTSSSLNTLPPRYEKLDRLIELEVKYRTQLQTYLQHDAKIDEEDIVLYDDETIRNELRYQNQLSHGLYTLQRIYICIGYLLTVNIKDSRYLVLSRLYEQQSSLTIMVEYLQSYLDHLNMEIDTNTSSNSLKDRQNIVQYEYEQLRYLQEQLLIIGGMKDNDKKKDNDEE